MDVYTKHAASLRSLQNELGQACPVFTPAWAQLGNIRILPGGVRTRRDNSPGGFSIDADLQLTCLLSDFGQNPPQSRQLFTYQGGTYRITNVTPAPNSLQVRIQADASAEKV